MTRPIRRVPQSHSHEVIDTLDYHAGEFTPAALTPVRRAILAPY
jgi:hypothetical protein